MAARRQDICAACPVLKMHGYQGCCSPDAVAARRCSMDGCRHSLTSSGHTRFCGTHGKWEHMHSRVEECYHKYMSEGWGYETRLQAYRELFMACSVRLVRGDSSGNSLQPLMPEGPATFVGLARLTAPHCEELLAQLVPLEATLNAPLHSRGNAAHATEDQRLRAREVAQLVLRRLHGGPSDAVCTVRLMDGHGRMLLAILKQVKELAGPERASAFLRRLRFQLVDVDAKVTAWHKFFFDCPHVRSQTEDVIKRVSGTRNAPVVEALADDVVLYLNFCGIAKSLPAVQALVRASRRPLIVSFSLARGARRLDMRVGGLKVAAGMHLRPVHTPRRDFATFVLDHDTSGPGAAVHHGAA